MNKTQIEWALNPDGSPGYTWNPITGCLNGCDYCYARKLANTRLRGRYLANENIAVPDDVMEKYRVEELLINAEYDPFYPRFWEDRFKIMKKRYWRLISGRMKPQKKLGIFTCDMSDLFGIGIPEEWTRRVLDAIRVNAFDRFYLLTKQPQNLIKFSPFPDNAWPGVTTTDVKMFITAINWLDEIEAKVKYISFEPLLGRIPINGEALRIAGIKWVIIGAQTKPTVYPKNAWVREIEDACDKAGIPVFEKNNLYPPGFRHLLRQELPK